MLFKTTLTPRFYETDALGHISNTALTAWFEVGRVRLLESLGAHGAQPVDWILAAITMDFLEETFYGTDVDIVITALEAGNTSLNIKCEMHQNGRITVRGAAVMVHLDPATKTKCRIPDALRDAIRSLTRAPA
mgnify:CR=1 FL=1